MSFTGLWPLLREVLFELLGISHDNIDSIDPRVDDGLKECTHCHDFIWRALPRAVCCNRNKLVIYQSNRTCHLSKQKDRIKNLPSIYNDARWICSGSGYIADLKQHSGWHARCSTVCYCLWPTYFKSPNRIIGIIYWINRAYFNSIIHLLTIIWPVLRTLAL